MASQVLSAAKMPPKYIVEIFTDDFRLEGEIEAVPNYIRNTEKHQIATVRKYESGSSETLLDLTMLRLDR